MKLMKVVLVAMPLVAAVALLQAVFLLLIWRWLVESAFGVGPPLQVWFAVTAGVAILMPPRDRTVGGGDNLPLTVILSAQLIRAAFLMIDIGLVWLTGVLIGWIR